MKSEKNHESVEEIISLYENHGNEDYIGEPVSQIEHMCQCGQLAEAAGADDDVVLAAFFHDIGHLCEFAFPEKSLQHMDKCGIADHEKLGADYLLSKGFSQKIAMLVQSHVAAKRYLTYAYPAYFDCLSEASKKTLEFQGGVMTHQEAAAFKADPLFNLYVSIRRWDDEAKKSNEPLPGLDGFKRMMIKHLSEQKKVNLQYDKDGGV
jgi:phosphonate degradation associated HDIG domain protein